METAGARPRSRERGHLDTTACVLPLRGRWDLEYRFSEASMNLSQRARLSGTVAAIGFIVSASLVAQQPPTAPPAANAARPTPLRSPDIRPDRTVTFRLLAPRASEVTLNGSWDSGINLKMTRDDAG